ncbi:NAD-dependent epimerase/dehydratase family protein [Desulfurivibrio dismutans]|uniref:NAD-dependent epimerase/dehydratase family protein n=1 Tax=Desulfurivibrio dismutans TaxID=1398908 RepID=UPI0023DA71B1|nr:NAD(P)-dependent oxidoreductase [Desulfurivibrio alkaliphilus]MDF1614310.1 NAD(P)-dependent oxidoreductase [Desulfurivibrio alkaliphilus]
MSLWARQSKLLVLGVSMGRGEFTCLGSVIKTGLLVGGSGLIGGGILHYFKKQADCEFELLAPNSKQLSLRDPEDIRAWVRRFRPEFIINCAITALDSSPLLAYETNYLGTLYLARAALELGVPYIHFSSAAVLPPGENLTEDDRLELTADLPNYPKSKLLAELALAELHQKYGLDYTNIRLAVVYGAHDHKVQGFHRLLFSIADQTMPLLFTNRQATHSYSNAKKVPPFVHHLLRHREEFGGKTWHFVDPLPVSLSELIITIKSYLELKRPREIYLPYPLARFGAGMMRGITRLLGRIGIEARMPAELLFMESFYQTQTLSSRRLRASSFVDPKPQATVFTELPHLLEYYLSRWEALNLITPYNQDFFACRQRGEKFAQEPQRLLNELDEEVGEPMLGDSEAPRKES